MARRTLRPRLRLVAGALLALTLALGTLTARTPPASATLVRALSLESLLREAHVVVRGDVLAQRTVLDAATGRFYTLTELRVSEVLRHVGQAPRVGDVVTLRQIGGRLDGHEQRVVGTAELEVGDELVVAARTDGAFLYLVGMAQGAFLVERRPEQPARLVRAPGGDLLRHPPARPVARAAAPPSLPLAELRALATALTPTAGGSR